MQLDIFYQRLSYEEIEQNIAFQLLSETGGLLGLLLGAIVCELGNFISLQIQINRRF